jgi:hypothetical protein
MYNVPKAKNALILYLYLIIPHYCVKDIGEYVKKLFNKIKKDRGQSFVELALIVPVLLLLLAGMVELAFFIFTYLTALDLTREAARFASGRDYRSYSGEASSIAKCSDTTLDYYNDTACFFIDPNFNPYFSIIDSDYSDVTISVFTVSDYDHVTDRWPEVGTSAKTDNMWTLNGTNWQKDCKGNTVLTEPYFSNSKMESLLSTSTDTAQWKGVVVVEIYYCYKQVLNLPVFSQIIPEKLRVHAYSLMPAPEAVPTPTTIH